MRQSFVTRQNFQQIRTLLDQFSRDQGLPIQELGSEQRAVLTKRLNTKLGAKLNTLDVGQLITRWARIEAHFSKQANHHDKVKAAIGGTLEASRGRVRSSRNDKDAMVLQIREHSSESRILAATNDNTKTDGVLYSIANSVLGRSGTAARLSVAVGIAGLTLLGGARRKTAQAETLDSAEVVGASQAAKQVPNVAAAVAAWSRKHNLFVVGDPWRALALPDRSDELQQRLAKSAPNFSVFLVERTDDHLRDEKALGIGIANKGDYGRIMDPNTGEQNGAILIVFIKADTPRGNRVSLSASAAFDKRGLGEDSWEGNLDQLFIAPMRSGRRLFDAVAQTAEGLNQRLKEALRNENAERQQQAQTLQQQIDTALATLATARVALQHLQNSAEQLREKGVKGGLAHPDLKGLRAELEHAERAAKQKNLNRASALTAAVRNKVEALLATLSDFNGAPQKFAALQAAITEQSGRRNIVFARNDLEIAKRKLAGATDAYRRGDSGYASSLLAAQAALDKASAILDQAGSGPQRLSQLQKQIDAQKGRSQAKNAEVLLRTAGENFAGAKAAFERGSAAYAQVLADGESAIAQATQTIDRAERAATTRNAAFAVSGLALFLGLLTAGFLAARRRRGVKDLSEKELAKVEKDIASRNQGLNKLLQSAAATVGEDPAKAKKFLEDETLLLAEKIINDVKRITTLILATELRAKDTRAVIFPSAFTRRIKNLFAKGEYQKALGMITNQPLAWDERLNEAIKEAATGKESSYHLWATELRAGIEEFKDFAAPFAEIVKIIQNLSDSLKIDMAEIQTALTEADEKITGTRSELVELKKKISEATALAKEDKLFSVAPLQGENALTTAVEEKLNEADLKKAKNPVGALSGSNQDAVKLISGANSLLQAAAHYRENFLKPLFSTRQVLVDNGMDVAWINERLQKLSARFSEICQQSKKDLNTTQLNGISKDLSDLCVHGRTVAELDTRRREDCAKAISAAKFSVQTARAVMSFKLAIAPELALAEKGDNPDTFIAAADRHLGQAKEHLDKGVVAAAEQSLAAADDACEHAKNLVQRYETAESEHVPTVAAIDKETQGLTALAAKRQEIFIELKSDYAENTIEEVGGAVTAARKLVAEVVGELKSAEDSYKKGEVLKASAQLGSCAARQRQAQAHLDAITVRREVLRQADAKNESVKEHLDTAILRLSGEKDDARTRLDKGAKADFDQAKALVDGVPLLKAGKRDPAKIEKSLAAADEAVRKADLTIQKDWQAHATATAGIHAAETAMADANVYKGSEGIVIAQRDPGKSDIKNAKALMEEKNYEEATALAAEGKNSAAAAKAKAEAENSWAIKGREAIEEGQAAIDFANDYIGNEQGVRASHGADATLGQAALALKNRDYDAAIRIAAGARDEALSSRKQAEGINQKQCNDRLALEAEVRRLAEIAHQQQLEEEAASRRAQEQQEAAEREREQQAEAERQERAEAERRERQEEANRAQQNDSGVKGSSW